MNLRMTIIRDVYILYVLGMLGRILNYLYKILFVLIQNAPIKRLEGMKVNEAANF